MTYNNALNYQPTQFNTIAGGANNGLTSVSPGIATYALTSQGAGNNPTFSPHAPGLVFLSQLTAAGQASVDFTSTISNTYNDYVLVISNVVANGSANQYTLKISQNNGGGYYITGYNSSINRFTAYNSATITNANTAVACQISGATPVVQTIPYSAVIYLYNLTNGKNFSLDGMFCHYFNSSSTLGYGEASATNAVANVNAIQISIAAGTFINSGTFSLYGVLE